jgi:hypothetical protein
MRIPPAAGEPSVRLLEIYQNDQRRNRRIEMV